MSENQRQVFLVPCSNEDATAHLEMAVLDGLDPDEYAGLTVNDGPVHLWGTKERYADRYEFHPGDILLFYTGDREYTVAALVRETTIKPSLAEEIWNVPDGEDPWSHLISLSEPAQVSIDSAEIAEYADHGLDYVIQFSRLNDEAINQIRSEYGSVLSYINSHQVGGSELTPEEIEAEDRGASGGFVTTGREVSKTTSAVDIPDIEDPILSDAESVLRHLKSRRAVLIYGPAGTGKRNGIRQLLTHWFDRERSDVDVEDRILETSFHDDTSVEDLLMKDSAQNTAPGPFTRFLDLAAADIRQLQLQETDPDLPRYTAVIEDFSKADPSTVFGQVWPLLSTDRRGHDHSITIGEHPIWVPKSLSIIGIVDSACTDLQSLPDGVRERFYTVTTTVDYDRLRNQYGYEDWDSVKSAADSDPDAEFDAQSILALEELNDRIRSINELGWGAQIGHFLLLPSVEREESAYCDVDLRTVWQQEIFSRLIKHTSSLEISLNQDIFEDFDAKIQSEGPLLPASQVKSLVEELAMQRI